jgi:hypothetical protein
VLRADEKCRRARLHELKAVRVETTGGRSVCISALHVDVLPSRVELKIVRVIDTPEATHIRYRVRR